MTASATRRLIEAAAALHPADRALLNLWVNRGIDDTRLTGLTGLSTEALRARRDHIVSGLANELGLPHEDVRSALDEIAPDDAVLAAAPSEPVRADRLSQNGAVAAPDPRPVRPLGRPGWLWAPIGVAALVVAAVIVGLTAGGSSPTSKRAADTIPASRPTSAPPLATRMPTVTTPTDPAGGAVPVPFISLPGGLTHPSGSIRLSGPVKHLKLNVRVRGLPRTRSGHYELWLYDSVLHSRALARLRDGGRTLTVSLPAGARRYRWIDISYQPPGVANHSGESVLRAPNPAHTTRARLRRGAARTRRRLRQAATVSAARRGAPERSLHPSRRAARRRGRAAHRAKRAVKGSRKARTSK